MVYKLEHLTTKLACQEAVQAANVEPGIETVLFSANMRYVSQRQLSMLRQMIDELADAPSTSQSGPPRKWVLLLHFMPGAALNDCYPSLFLYGWNFWYLDSCTGGVSSSEMLQMASWSAAAVALFSGQAIQPMDLLGVHLFPLLIVAS